MSFNKRYIEEAQKISGTRRLETEITEDTSTGSLQGEPEEIEASSHLLQQPSEMALQTNIKNEDIPSPCKPWEVHCDDTSSCCSIGMFDMTELLPPSPDLHEAIMENSDVLTSAQNSVIDYASMLGEQTDNATSFLSSCRPLPVPTPDPVLAQSESGKRNGNGAASLVDEELIMTEISKARKENVTAADGSRGKVETEKGFLPWERPPCDMVDTMTPLAGKKNVFAAAGPGENIDTEKSEPTTKDKSSCNLEPLTTLMVENGCEGMMEEVSKHGKGESMHCQKDKVAQEPCVHGKMTTVQSFDSEPTDNPVNLAMELLAKCAEKELRVSKSSGHTEDTDTGETNSCNNRDAHVKSPGNKRKSIIGISQSKSISLEDSFDAIETLVVFAYEKKDAVLSGAIEAAKKRLQEMCLLNGTSGNKEIM